MAASEREPCPGAGCDEFHLRSGELWCEDVPVAALAERFGTPLYVYSARSLDRRIDTVRAAFGPEAHVCYAVKANSNLSLLRRVHARGAGFDLVSGGELERLRCAGLPTAGAVFAGVAKQAWEIEAAVAAGILFFNVESAHELPLLAAAGAAAGRRVAVAVRLNPDVDAGTHAYISTGKKENKFGIALASAGAVVAAIRRERWLDLVGYHVHLGSQLRSVAPYQEALAARRSVRRRGRRASRRAHALRPRRRLRHRLRPGRSARRGGGRRGVVAAPAGARLDPGGRARSLPGRRRRGPDHHGARREAAGRHRLPAGRRGDERP
jgi:diaminopimelate decarboxylase